MGDDLQSLKCSERILGWSGPSLVLAAKNELILGLRFLGPNASRRPSRPGHLPTCCNFCSMEPGARSAAAASETAGSASSGVQPNRNLTATNVRFHDAK
jgi:hypothetical protein